MNGTKSGLTGRDDAHGERSRRTVRLAGLLGVGMAVGRGLGLVRDIAIAAYLGTSGVAEAWLVAFRLPNLLGYQMSTGAFNPAFVPIFNEIATTRGLPEARRAASHALTAFGLLLVILTILGAVAAPWVVRVIAPGFIGDAEKFELTVKLSRWCFLYLGLIGGSAALMALAQSVGHYVSSSLTPIVANATMILAIFFLCPLFGAEPSRWVYGLIAGVMLSGVVQVLIHVVPLRRRRIMPTFSFDLRHEGVVRTAALLPATILNVLVMQLLLMVNMILASLLGEGSVAALEYASRVAQFPYLIATNAIAAALLPMLSRLAASGQTDDLARTLILAVRGAVFLLLPVAVTIAVLGEPIVALLFQRGSFGVESTTLTATALVFLVPIMIGEPAVRILSVGFFALKDPRTPVRVAAVTLVLDVALAVPLMSAFGLGGLALAAGVAPIGGALALYVLLAARIGAPRVMWRRTVAAMITGSVVLYLVIDGVAGALPELEGVAGKITDAVLPALAGLVAFGGVVLAFRVPEVSFLTRLIRSRLKPQTRSPGDVR